MSQRPHSVRSIDSEDVVEVFNVEVVKQKPRNPSGRSTFSAVCLVLTCTTAMVVNSANLAYVSIALPAISRELSIPVNQLQWVISAYSLTSGCFLLMIGRIADLYGRKRVFMSGSLFSVIFTIACGFSKTKEALFLLRAIQGIGAAATIPAALGILAQSFPPSKARAVAFTTFSTGNPLGGGLGMALGGALTALSPITWRASFFLFAGITFICLVGGAIFIDRDKPSTEKDGRVDWIGAFLVTVGLTFITIVLNEGETAPNRWANPYIIVLMIFGVILMVAFFVWQARLERIQSDLDYPRSWLTPPPLMKVSLWTRAKGRIAAVMWIAALTFCVFRGWQYWVQLYYQEYLRLSPIQTMLRVLPMFIAGILCNFFIAQVVGRIPIVYIVVLGASVTSTSSLLFALIDPTASYWAFGFPAAVFSVWGADFVFSSGTLYVAKTVAQNEQSLAGAVMQTMTQLGTTLGIPISTIVYNRIVEKRAKQVGWFLNSTGSNAPLFARLAGYRGAQWTSFGFGVIAIILGLIFLPGVGIVGHKSPSSSSQSKNNTEPDTDNEKADIETGMHGNETIHRGKEHKDDASSTTGVSTVTHISDSDFSSYVGEETGSIHWNGVDFSRITDGDEAAILKLGEHIGMVKGKDEEAKEEDEDEEKDAASDLDSEISSTSGRRLSHQ